MAGQSAIRLPSLKPRAASASAISPGVNSASRLAPPRPRFIMVSAANAKERAWGATHERQCKRASVGGKAKGDRRADAFLVGSPPPVARLARRPGETPDPYRVWLSEVLLQQTTAQAATPYYQAFIEKWPRVQDLAAAPLEAVISAFAGLGYYSRARNLHACAKEIARRGGRFPAEEASLCALPGVGAYTAAAIAAIAFGRETLPVDGNIARILARLIALEKPVARARGEIAAAARALAPSRESRRFRPGADGYRRDPLPPAQSRLRRLPAGAGLRGVSRRDPEAYPRRARGEAETAPAGRGVLRPPFRRRLSRPPPPAARPSRLDRRTAGRAVDGEGRWTAGSPGAPVAARWRRLPGEVEQVFTHFALKLTVYAAEFEGAPRPAVSGSRPTRSARQGFRA